MTTASRVPVHVLLLFGDQAKVVGAGRDHRDPWSIPTAQIAEETGVPAQDLPGRDLTAVYDGETLACFQPAD